MKKRILAALMVLSMMLTGLDTSRFKLPATD